MSDISASGRRHGGKMELTRVRRHARALSLPHKLIGTILELVGKRRWITPALSLVMRSTSLLTLKRYFKRVNVPKSSPDLSMNVNDVRRLYQSLLAASSFVFPGLVTGGTQRSSALPQHQTATDILLT